MVSGNNICVFNEDNRKKGNTQVCCDSETIVVTYRQDWMPLFDFIICKKHAVIPYEVAEILYLRPVYIFPFTSKSAYVHGCVVCGIEDVFTLCTECVNKMTFALYGEIGKLVKGDQ